MLLKACLAQWPTNRRTENSFRRTEPNVAFQERNFTP